jgi:hypothetical protein
MSLSTSLIWVSWVSAASIPRPLGGRHIIPTDGTSAALTENFFRLADACAAFDLPDRGVTGRPSPDPVEAFLYTERSIYRPGETESATASTTCP